MGQKSKTCLVQKKKKKNDLEVQATKQEEQKPHVQHPSMDEIQSTSMIEDAEIGGSQSCIASCSQSDESTKEINSADIKDEPMVQKAIEMFEATKVTIQSKI